MTEALDSLNHPATMPVIMRPAFIAAARTGKRTHIFLPATYVPGQRAISEQLRQTQPARGTTARPTRFAGLKIGDRLWVQEETAALIGLGRHAYESRMFYRLELQGGHVPIPGAVRGRKWKTATYAAKDLKREHSRYHIEVTGVRRCRAREITWPEIEREGTYNPHTTKGAWWGWQYGILMPWENNPEVISLDFRWGDGNIDTGERWVPEAPPPPPPPNKYLERMSATPASCSHIVCPDASRCTAGCIEPRQCGVPPVKD